ncbi:MAG: hypothetical protein LBJ37_01550 [Paucimonas sp.]|jgi:methyl-accepting chemotaxis protein|nr:hypothetical protein [Paucimonas sp.]
MTGFTSTLMFCLLLLLPVLCAVGWRLRVRLRQQRAEARRLRQRSEQLQRDSQRSLGELREELAHLASLARQVGTLGNECDTALQQQQRKLDRVGAALVQIKVESRQLEDDARLVGSESRQSMRLATQGQAGLSATLMAFRCVERRVQDGATTQAEPSQELRVLARQGRDQTYDANLALAGITAAASTIEERALSIGVACEAQARGVEALDVALSDVQRLAFASAWRSRQACAASEALLDGAQRLEARIQDLQQDDGGTHAAVQESGSSLPRTDEMPRPGTCAG